MINVCSVLNKKKLGSYSLQFFLETLFICEKEGLLICYPSQLNGKNNKNGTIISIPYRLNSTKINKVTKLCENKRFDFCKKNKKECTSGNVGYSRWNGILIKTENNNKGIIYINIFISLTDKIYKFESLNDFTIKFGQKDDIFTYLYSGNDDKKLKINEGKIGKEFLSKINKGAYLYKYASLWALGLDLLPISAQRYINLFVYRGCSCKLQAKFITPLIKISELAFNTKLNTTQEKHCEKRQTNQIYELDNIFEKPIYFIILPDKNGTKGKIDLNFNYSKNNFYILKKNASIIFERNLTAFNWKNININGNWSEDSLITFEKNNQILSNVKIIIYILIQKHYFWITMNYDNIYISTNIFWPKEWWKNENQFNENIKANLLLNGDFIPISIISVGHVNKTTKKIQNRPIIEPFRNNLFPSPYSRSFENMDIINGTKFVFRGFTTNNQKDKKIIKIALLHGNSNLLSIKKIGAVMLLINIKGDEVTLESDNSHQTVKQNISINNKAFECVIEVFSVLINKIKRSYYNVYINENKLDINGYIPISSIDHIFVNGTVQLFISPIILLPKDTDLINKYKLDQLKESGTIFCFEAFVLTAINMSESNNFEINLFHDANQFSEKIGDTVLNLIFTFNPKQYNEENKNIKNLDQSLIMKSYIHEENKWTDEIKYLNPIGQTGVYFTLRIDVNKYYFNIIINNAIDYIHYKHQLPYWATEWIMIKGNIDQIKYGNDSDKCNLQYKSSKENLNIIQIPQNKLLKDGSLIIIDGIYNDELISITFLHEALEWHHYIGHTIFQINFTKEGETFMGSYAVKF